MAKSLVGLAAHNTEVAARAENYKFQTFIMAQLAPHLKRGEWEEAAEEEDEEEEEEELKA